MAREIELLDFYVSKYGRKNQLPNGVCVVEDVNPETEMFVLSEDSMLVPYTKQLSVSLS